jgi:hypothetical protein
MPILPAADPQKLLRTGVLAKPVCVGIYPTPTRGPFCDRSLALSPARLKTNPGQFVLIVMKVQEP